MIVVLLVQSIDDAFFERDVEMLELAFEGQMHFGCFYAYVKLKEQVQHVLGWCVDYPIRNVTAVSLFSLLWPVLFGETD